MIALCDELPLPALGLLAQELIGRTAPWWPPPSGRRCSAGEDLAAQYAAHRHLPQLAGVLPLFGVHVPLSKTPC